jgi:lipopolysaccharide/colanic/teichoic acid biosynthesis glycosyltransferase
MLYRAIKRTIDVFAALIGLSICGIFYIPLAILIKLDSTGPVIFSQDRIGLNGKSFKCYKFRTMYVSVANHSMKPAHDDKRVTKFGYHLRRWSVDELPQFWNILIGDMSLVGPRPELVSVVQEYQAWQHQRHSVKPGLTGWWQIQGRKQPMSVYTLEDIYYVEHQSLALDLLILWRSLKAVITGKGAT